MAVKKKPTDDILTTTAQAIGSTLGKLAVSAGIAKPTPKAPVKSLPAAKKAALKKKTANVKVAVKKKIGPGKKTK